MKVIVTGGRSDIGRAIIQRRLELGDEVLTTASSEPTLLDLQKKMSSHPKLQICQWDLAAPEAGSETIDGFIQGGVDGLVLNAAPATRALKRLHEISLEEVTEATTAHLNGNIWLLKKCLPLMLERKFGRIVFLSSIAVHGTSRYSLYAMAKSGMEGLLKVLATDYGEFNIRANSIRPGIIATDRNKRFWSRSDYMDLMAEVIPAGTLGRPEEIAEAVDPFLSVNCYANGAILEVAGGLPNFRSDFFLKTKIK